MFNSLKALAAVLMLASISMAGCTTTETSHQKTLDQSLAQRHSVPLDHLPALKGDYFEIDSKTVGRKFHIYTRLPEGYERDTTERYPVVYLLDGDSLFPLLSPTHLFLTYDEQLPEAIIVGISYGGFDQSINKRHIDFSAPAPDAPPGEDGAPQFLSFLRNELIPAVEGRYRINSDKRVLLGQSRGGYFVLWSALEAPDLFWGRIASNPSLTPGRDRFFGAAAHHGRNDLGVVVASGSRDTEQRRINAKEWAEAWTRRQDAPWQVKYLPIQDGTHAASIGEVYRQSMLWLFKDEIRAKRAQK